MTSLTLHLLVGIIFTPPDHRNLDLKHNTQHTNGQRNLKLIQPGLLVSHVTIRIAFLDGKEELSVAKQGRNKTHTIRAHRVYPNRLLNVEIQTASLV